MRHPDQREGNSNPCEQTISECQCHEVMADPKLSLVMVWHEERNSHKTDRLHMI